MRGFVARTVPRVVLSEYTCGLVVDIFMLDGKRSARLVFSIDHGRVCAVCELPIGECACCTGVLLEAGGDGFVRVRRETQGRGGKTVTVSWGLARTKAGVAEMTRDLKRACGAGGSVKLDRIEIQGDHRDAVVRMLRERGYKVKLAGG